METTSLYNGNCVEYGTRDSAYHYRAVSDCVNICVARTEYAYETVERLYTNMQLPRKVVLFVAQ